MHVQSNPRESRIVSPNQIVHEVGSPEHEAEVVEATSTRVVVEYPGREPIPFTPGEFSERFEW